MDLHNPSPYEQYARIIARARSTGEIGDPMFQTPLHRIAAGFTSFLPTLNDVKDIYRSSKSFKDWMTGPGNSTKYGNEPGAEYANHLQDILDFAHHVGQNMPPDLQDPGVQNALIGIGVGGAGALKNLRPKNLPPLGWGNMPTVEPSPPIYPRSMYHADNFAGLVGRNRNWRFRGAKRSKMGGQDSRIPAQGELPFDITESPSNAGGMGLAEPPAQLRSLGDHLSEMSTERIQDVIARMDADLRDMHPSDPDFMRLNLAHGVLSSELRMRLARGAGGGGVGRLAQYSSGARPEYGPDGMWIDNQLARASSRAKYKRNQIANKKAELQSPPEEGNKLGPLNLGPSLPTAEANSAALREAFMSRDWELVNKHIKIGEAILDNPNVKGSLSPGHSQRRMQNQVALNRYKDAYRLLHEGDLGPLPPLGKPFSMGEAFVASPHEEVRRLSDMELMARATDVHGTQYKTQIIDELKRRKIIPKDTKF